MHILDICSEIWLAVSPTNRLLGPDPRPGGTSEIILGIESNDSYPFFHLVARLSASDVWLKLNHNLHIYTRKNRCLNCWNNDGESVDYFWPSTYLEDSSSMIAEGSSSANGIDSLSSNLSDLSSSSLHRSFSFSIFIQYNSFLCFWKQDLCLTEHKYNKFLYCWQKLIATSQVAAGLSNFWAMFQWFVHNDPF